MSEYSDFLHFAAVVKKTGMILSDEKANRKIFYRRGGAH